mgnify:CR=1 FL=1
MNVATAVLRSFFLGGAVTCGLHGMHALYLAHSVHEYNQLPVCMGCGTPLPLLLSWLTSHPGACLQVAHNEIGHVRILKEFLGPDSVPCPQV